jgi:hypothetical protein
MGSERRGGLAPDLGIVFECGRKVATGQKRADISVWACGKTLFAVAPQLKGPRKAHIIQNAAGMKGWLQAFRVVSGGGGVSAGPCNLT